MDDGTKIVIVGCGLLGSMIARPICAFATSLDVDIEVTLIDFDKVEKRNSPSDLGVPGNIGKYKTEVVKAIYEAAGIVVNTQRARITDKSLWMLKGYSMIIGALDNVPSRLRLLEAAALYNTPYIDLGLSPVGGAVSWSYGNIVTMPFAMSVAKDYKPPEDKPPACALVATRIFSAVVTECAAISIFIYISGHDPGGYIFEDAGRIAENGDMLNWYVSLGGGQVNAKPRCITPKREVQDGISSD